MKNGLASGLLLVLVLAVLLLVVEAFLPPGQLQAVIALPFLFFGTGYSLILAIYPGRQSIGSFERFALSFGFSIVVLAFVGLILNYTQWGIRLYPVLVSLIVFTIATAAIAWERQRRMPEENRFRLALNIPGLLGKGQKRSSQALSVILAVAILATVGTLAYAMAAPTVGERFTEFYILGVEGKAQNYPDNMVLGQTGMVTVGVINREQETTTYHVEVWLGSTKLNETKAFQLEPDARWEQPVSFTPEKTGTDLKLEFRLFRAGQSDPYLKPVYIWLNVN